MCEGAEKRNPQNSTVKYGPNLPSYLRSSK
jgi:hypothetical protein